MLPAYRDVGFISAHHDLLSGTDHLSIFDPRVEDCLLAAPADGGNLFQAVCDFKETLGDKKAFGFTFRYQGKEGELQNRTIMVRNGGCIYYLTSQIRTDRENESKPVINEIWRSLSWIG